MSRPVILCVDDERIILNSLKAQLLNNFKSEFRIELAESAEEALEIVDELSAQQIELPVVIADQIMAGMKGDELLSRIKELLPQTMTIMLTGQATADAVGKAVNKAGLFRYLSKPWDEDDLILTVQSALDTWSHQKKLMKQTHYQSVLNQILLLALKPIVFAEQIQEALNRLVAVPCFSPPAKGGIYFQASSHFFQTEASSDKENSGEPLHFKLLASAFTHGNKIPDSLNQPLFQEEIQLKPHDLAATLNFVPEHAPVISGLPPGAHYLCPIMAEQQMIGLLVIYLADDHSHSEQIESFLSSFCHSLSGMFRLSASNYALSQSNLKLEQNKQALEELVQSRTEELHQSLKALEEKNQLLIHANKELAYHATTDSLTGLANRRSFFEQANRQLSNDAESETPASVAMVDLDYFKQINDQYGHQAGDTVLAHIAEVLIKSLDMSHIIGRVGGEEFAVFMPETTPEQAVSLCNTLLDTISSAQIQIDSAVISITGSIGLSEIYPDERLIEKAINRADQALYESKHKGRNTLCIYSTPQSDPEIEA